VGIGTAMCTGGLTRTGGDRETAQTRQGAALKTLYR
jgi:hypothetical protein